jgi:hypothetical protein
VWAGVVTRRSSGARCWTWWRLADRWSTWRGILGSAPQSIYVWGRQDRIDKGREPGLSSAEKAELTAAKQRITELETELAIHRRSANCSGR